MAQASRRLKHLRRTKRKNSLLNRALQATHLEKLKVYTAFMAVLYQGAQPVSVTQASLDYVSRNLRRLGFTLTKWPTEAGVFVVELTEDQTVPIVAAPTRGGISDMVTTAVPDDTSAQDPLDTPALAAEVDPDHHDVSRFADEGCPHV